jgi:PAS domain S-box-containing protein
MNKKNVQLPGTAELRLQAEEQLKKQALSGSSASQTTEQLLHELQVLSQARYFSLFDLAPVGYIALDEKGSIVEANLTAATQLGVTRNALVEQLLTHFILPEDQDIYCRQHKQLFEKEARQVYELRMLRAGAEPFWARLEATVAEDADGAKVCRAVLVDITKDKQTEMRWQRANRALKVMNECNQVLVRTDNEAEFLQKMCEIIVNVGEYRMAWIGFAEQDAARSVRPVAQVGFEEGYLGLAQISWAENERGRGPTGTAIREEVAQVNQNFLTNPKMKPWRETALLRGYQSSIALPLKSEDSTFGALTIYSAFPDAFDEDEVHLLTELANDLAFGVNAARGRARRKRAEAAVRQLSSIVEQTEDTVVVTDRDGIIEYVNPAFERLTGYAREEAVGRKPGILKSGVHDDPFYQGLWKTILDGGVFFAEIANRKKDGELFYEAKTITPLRNEDGNITHFVATGKDITGHKRDEEKLRKAYDELELRVQERTEELRIAISELRDEVAERKKMEESLRASEENYRLLLQYAPTAIFEIDYIGPCFKSVNDAMCQLTGYSREELLSTSPFDLLDEESKKRFQKRIGKALAGEKTNDNVEFRVIVKDGRKLWAILNVKPIYKDGKTDGALVVGHDITERKRAETEIQKYVNELRSANEELTRFNRNMVGRELRMIELKKEVNALCGQAGQLLRYPMDFEKDA